MAVLALLIAVNVMLLFLRFRERSDLNRTASTIGHTSSPAPRRLLQH
jgi:hypothetical protein